MSTSGYQHTQNMLTSTVFYTLLQSASSTSYAVFRELCAKSHLKFTTRAQKWIFFLKLWQLYKSHSCLQVSVIEHWWHELGFHNAYLYLDGTFTFIVPAVKEFSHMIPIFLAKFVWYACLVGISNMNYLNEVVGDRWPVRSFLKV